VTVEAVQAVIETEAEMVEAEMEVEEAALGADHHLEVEDIEEEEEVEEDQDHLIQIIRCMWLDLANEPLNKI